MNTRDIIRTTVLFAIVFGPFWLVTHYCAIKKWLGFVTEYCS